MEQKHYEAIIESLIEKIENLELDNFLLKSKNEQLEAKLGEKKEG